MNDIILHVQVNVTRNCLLEFLDVLYENKCHDICVTYSDYGWHVQYDSPFVHNPEVKKPAEEYEHPKMKASDAVGPLCCPCSPQMIAEADCEGDKDKCGGICYAKSKQKND